jgi:hypothetical protein
LQNDKIMLYNAGTNPFRAVIFKKVSENVYKQNLCAHTCLPVGRAQLVRAVVLKNKSEREHENKELCAVYVPIAQLVRAVVL